jgi:putative transposase
VRLVQAGRDRCWASTRRELELATLSWVDWWNRDRLHGELGHVPPIEYEQAF